MDGPYTKTVGVGNGTHFMRRTWYRQPKPYKAPLPFTFDERWVSGYDTYFPNVGGASSAPGDLAYRRAYSKAYAKYSDSVKAETAQLMTNFLERASSVDMIAGRVKQLITFARFLARGKVFQALRALGQPRSQARIAEKKHAVSKSLANQWLELHFGWVPLVKDIYAAIDVLQSDSNARSALGKSGARELNSSVNGSTSWPIYSVSTTDEFVGVRLASQIWIENPNLFRANALGLTNPVSWVFEGVPFSFVADWFTNASQFLTAWDTHIGLTVTGAHTTSFAYNEYRTEPRQGSGWYPGVSGPSSGWAIGVGVSRTLGISSPPFVMKSFRGFSVERGATAMSLLIQMLPR